MDISKTIKSLRLKNRYTQEQLADICNVSRQAVAKWESGANFPDIEKLVRLTQIFQVSIDELITGEAPVPQRISTSDSLPAYAENEKLVN